MSQADIEALSKLMKGFNTDEAVIIKICLKKKSLTTKN